MSTNDEAAESWLRSAYARRTSYHRTAPEPAEPKPTDLKQGARGSLTPSPSPATPDDWLRASARVSADRLREAIEDERAEREHR